MDQGSNQQPVVVGDTPTHRRTVDEMSDEELTRHVEGIRHRRLLMQHEYEKAQEAKATAKREKDKVELEHQLKMLDKEFTSIDKAIVKLEARVGKVKAIRVFAERVSA